MVSPVGLVGVGAMGQSLLNRFNIAGIDVRAFDLKPECMKKAEALGATLAASCADAARGVSLVHVIVRSDDDILTATLGKDGVLEGAEPGTRVILHSTILPPTTRKIAAEAEKKGVIVIDACITSVPRRLWDGHGVFLVGGPDDVVAELRPHLQSLGKDVHHFGPLTSGNVAKISKNLTNGIERVMVFEAARLAEAGGIDPKQFLEMAKSINTGAFVTSWDRALEVRDGHVDHMPDADSILLQKDVPHAAKLAEMLGVDLPVTQAAAARVKSWMDGWK